MNSSTIKDSELSLLLKRRSSDGSTSFGKVIHGNHVDVVSGFPVNLKSLCTLCFQSEDPTKEVRQALVAFLKDESRVESLHERVWSLLVFGVALLELYSQANFTGPELSRKQLEQLHGTDDIEVHRRVLQHLECDGLYPFTSVDIPHILLLARIVLALVASPLRTSWKDGINLTKEGLIFLPTIDNKTDNYLFLVQMSEICESLYSAQWWQARALILHSRLLQGQSYEQSPTLWMEANEAFCTAITTVCSVDGVDLPVELFATVDLSSCHISPREWSLEDVSCTTREGIVLSSSVLLEWGLACHHFNYGDKVRVDYFIFLGHHGTKFAFLLLGKESLPEGERGSKTTYDLDSSPWQTHKVSARGHRTALSLRGLRHHRRERVSPHYFACSNENQSWFCHCECSISC